MTETLRIASPTLLAVQLMCSFPIAKLSTSQAATWLSAGAGRRPSMDLFRNYGRRADLSGNLGNSWLCATVTACTEPSELPATDARMAAHDPNVGGALCRQHVLGTSAGRFIRSRSCFRVVACPGNKRGVESPLSFVDERPLYSLSSARSYGTASPNAASNSPVEPSGLFPHGLENP